jgi:carbon monoxide dehydrogenase subunit G
MKIEKKFVINAPVEKVWGIITEPKLIAQCIPGCESVEELSEGKYKAAVKIEVGPIKTLFNISILELERDAPNYAVYDTSGDEGGRASSIKAKSKLQLTALDPEKTEVAVTSDLNIIGRLGKFGTGMMNKIIDGISQDTIGALAAYIERGELPAAKKGPGKLTLLFWAVITLIALGILVLVI